MPVMTVPLQRTEGGPAEMRERHPRSPHKPGAHPLTVRSIGAGRYLGVCFDQGALR